jgi:hypothetical protein
VFLKVAESYDGTPKPVQYHNYRGSTAAPEWRAYAQQRALAFEKTADEENTP